MTAARALIDPTLTDGVSIFAHGDTWVLRRRDGVFVAIRGDDVSDVGDTDRIGSHPGLGPEFARAGFLRASAQPPTAPRPRITGQGAFHDAVAPLIEAATRGFGSTPRSCCQLLDGPPERNQAPTPGIAVWPEGAQVFISPMIVAEDTCPVTIADVLDRRVAAFHLPDLLCGYLDAHRRGPVTLEPDSALLIAALTVGQLADGGAARRRLRTIDLDALTWVDRPILPVPIPVVARRGW